MENKLTVTINKAELPIKEYQGQRVVTMKEIDAVHERPEGTARKRFNDNKVHFIEGVDYFNVTQPSEIRTLGLERPQGGTPESVTLITESGYLMLVKSFTDDLAWAVQRQLVNTYFRAMPEKRRAAAQQSKLQIDPAKLAAAEAKLNNSRARLAAEWRKIAGIVRVPEYQDLCASYAATALAGKEIIPLPSCTEHLYTATEIGAMLGGIDKAKIGHIANVNGLKAPEYGKSVWDKSPYSNKQVESFRYNDKALERFRVILGIHAG